MVSSDVRVIKNNSCFPIGSTFETEGSPSPELLADAFKSAFGENMKTVHITVILPDGRRRPLSLQIVEISHADNSGQLIDFKANLDPTEGFGRFISGRCNGITRKTCISVVRV